MKKTKKAFLALLLALCMLALTACGGGSSSAAPPAGSTGGSQAASGGQSEGGAAGGYKFAFAVKNQTNPQFIAIAEGMQQACDEAGATLNVQATESETEIDMQIQMLQTFLTQDYDAIFVTPLSSTAIVPFVKECNDAGVPIICVDTLADAAECEKIGAKVDYYVSCDNKNAGELAAQAMVDKLGASGKIAILEGTPGTSSGTAINEGMTEVLAGTDIHVAASQTAEWNRNMGYDVTQSILTANPDLEGILAANDEMALGAINALKDGGFEMIPVIGINNVPDAQASIQAGELYATVDKVGALQGSTAVEGALKILAGEPVDEGAILPCKLVTADGL